MYESNINKKKKKHDKIVLFSKNKLNTIEIFIYKSLINSYINHEEFVTVNNVLREYSKIKEEIKMLKMLWNILHKKYKIVIIKVCNFLIQKKVKNTERYMQKISICGRIAGCVGRKVYEN